MNEPLLAGNRDPTLPDFLIIGAQKAGTTALMMNLDVHPGVAMAGSGGIGAMLHGRQGSDTAVGATLSLDLAVARIGRRRGERRVAGYAEATPQCARQAGLPGRGGPGLRWLLCRPVRSMPGH